MQLDVLCGRKYTKNLCHIHEPSSILLIIRQFWILLHNNTSVLFLRTYSTYSTVIHCSYINTSWILCMMASSMMIASALELNRRESISFGVSNVVPGQKTIPKKCIIDWTFHSYIHGFASPQNAINLVTNLSRISAMTLKWLWWCRKFHISEKQNVTISAVKWVPACQVKDSNTMSVWEKMWHFLFRRTFVETVLWQWKWLWKNFTAQEAPLNEPTVNSLAGH